MRTRVAISQWSQNQNQANNENLQQKTLFGCPYHFLKDPHCSKKRQHGNKPTPSQSLFTGLKLVLKFPQFLPLAVKMLT